MTMHQLKQVIGTVKAMKGKHIVTHNKQKRSLLDDVIDFGRELLGRIDEALTPPQEREPVRIPIPVREDMPTPPQNPRH